MLCIHRLVLHGAVVVVLVTGRPTWIVVVGTSSVVFGLLRLPPLNRYPDPHPSLDEGRAKGSEPEEALTQVNVRERSHAKSTMDIELLETSWTEQQNALVATRRQLQFAIRVCS